MTVFDSLLKEFAATGTLVSTDLATLRRVADPFRAAREDLAESLGMIGGNEADAAKIVGAECAERERLVAVIRSVVTGEHRPADVAAFRHQIAGLRGRPPAGIAGALGVMPDWVAVADAIERRLLPPKLATRGGELHEVA